MADQSYKHMALGLPPDGPKPGSQEADALQAAESFLADLRTEIDEYDRANAKAFEDKLGRWAFWKSATPVAAAAGAAVLRDEAPQVRDDGSVVHRTRDTSGTTNRPQLLRSFLRRKRNVDKVPLLQRRWVPLVCVAGLILVWTPDMWKLRGLHYADSYYAATRRWIHTQYWRATMNPEDFNTLMAEIAAEKARSQRSVKGSDCPF